MSLIPKRIRERILAKKRKLDSYRPLPPALVEQVRRGLLVEYTYSSNAIEGNTLTLGETRMVIEEGVTIDALYFAGKAYDKLGEATITKRIFRTASSRWPSHPWSKEMRDYSAG